MIEAPIRNDNRAKTVSIFCFILAFFLYVLGLIEYENYVQITIFSILLLSIELFYDSGYTQLPERLLDIRDYNESKSDFARIILSVSLTYPLSILVMLSMPMTISQPLLMLSFIVFAGIELSRFSRSNAPLNFASLIPQRGLLMPLLTILILFGTSLAIGFVSSQDDEQIYIAIKQDKPQSLDLYDTEFSVGTSYTYLVEILSNSNENLTVEVQLNFYPTEIGIMNETKTVASFPLNFNNTDSTQENFTVSFDQEGLYRIDAILYKGTEEKIQIRQTSLFVNVEA